MREKTKSAWWWSSWITFGAILLFLMGGCAFQNSNPFTGATSWTIGDACNDCAYDENGYPTKGQASGPLSEHTAKALSDAAAAKAAAECTGSKLDECRAALEEEEPAEEKLAEGPVELPDAESDAILETVYGPDEPDTMGDK